MPTTTDAGRWSRPRQASGSARQPIGYWVKLFDRLIEASFDQTLGARRLSRRHWQALNVIRAGSASRARLHDALAPFVSGDEGALTQVIDDLLARGWIAETDGRLSLTPAGERAVATIGDEVRSVRARVTDGLTEQQYAATVDALARMCANLRQFG